MSFDERMKLGVVLISEVHVEEWLLETPEGRAPWLRGASVLLHLH